MMADCEHNTSLNRVCVWFGQHMIVEHLDDPLHAAEFEQAMRQRFKDLRVTNQPATTAVSPDAADS